jgi:hypothetical protein
MDSTLVVAYSYTGNSRRLALLLCAQKGWPFGEVIEERPRAGGWGTLRCMLDSLLRARPTVRYEGPEPADFRTVVLVAPIWVGQLAGPMRAFVNAYRDRLQRVALMITMGGQGASNAVAEVARILGRDPVLAEAVTARAVEDGSCAFAVNAFGTALLPPQPGVPLRAATLSPEAA